MILFISSPSACSVLLRNKSVTILDMMYYILPHSVVSSWLQYDRSIPSHRWIEEIQEEIQDKLTAKTRIL